MAEKVTPWEDYKYSPRLPDFYQVVGATMGLTTMVVNNAFKRLPYFYNPMMNIPLSLGLGIAIGTGAKMLRVQFMDNKIRIAEAYIQAHPEDFIEQPKKTYGEVLMQWRGVR